VDHYELNLINKVKTGDWLGERIDPTPGTAGKSVKGNRYPQDPEEIIHCIMTKLSQRRTQRRSDISLCAEKWGGTL